MVPELKRKEGTKKIDDETFPSNFNTAIIKLPEEEWFTYTSQLSVWFSGEERTQK